MTCLWGRNITSTSTGGSGRVSACKRSVSIDKMNGISGVSESDKKSSPCASDASDNVDKLQRHHEGLKRERSLPLVQQD